MPNNIYLILVFIGSIVFFSSFTAMMMNHGYDKAIKQNNINHNFTVSTYMLPIENPHTVSP